ncbi:DNA polymerase III subunit chi [Thioalkalivibrio thiocyanodenitrificans]|uniref:DNA polymerase III subunit chi n=1 Tax=Thioalkalivibrio thiocyanodenitrificans TaxID=243063 RepID=UPI0003812C27|nr:DNA polymerase III subunit chi [Thioalkalivibrio thiocyanodenitrificans]
MTRIDFYVLDDEDPGERLRMACRIIQKAFGLGHRIHVHTGSAGLSGQLDEALWTFRDISFIPHEVEGSDPDCPVQICHDREPDTAGEILVNLDSRVPLFFSRFERVAEIVNQEPTVRDAGRERYRFYRDRGYDLTHHRLGPPGRNRAS